jgi:L-lactate dehydrogenase complex protein LldG
MNAETVSTFEESLADLDVSCTLTTAGALLGTLSSIVDQPAVGTPLPFKGVSLVDMEITTDPTMAQLDEAHTGVTAAGLGIADYGTTVIQSTPAGDELVSLFCTDHVVVVAASDLVPTMSEAFEWFTTRVGEARESVVLATGPSSTADMGALVRGIHGPKNVHVVVLSDR